MLNDLWAVGRLNFFSASLLEAPFAVFRFSEGFGVDIRSDIKTQTSFFDPAFWFVIFFDPWISLALRQIIFLLIGTQGLFSLLRLKGVGADHALVMASLVADRPATGRSNRLHRVSVAERSPRPDCRCHPAGIVVGPPVGSAARADSGHELGSQLGYQPSGAEADRCA